ncbi:beta-1,3-galactosyltransferase 5-like [Mizuhopecten yessoensis]|uniref:Hexosyltransferase n=1 Tax=Mizuhopecten yessoensis TaxID=6573 RepID=A0A210QL80_MIZYE|nr:beta-1,3-galactosyltransferase 5-like [Mizuhopecten yessoensis]OWF49499.1 Beta-1,3-galactosyltransferase 5 [Mizuhopecten yessoensis]
MAISGRRIVTFGLIMTAVYILINVCGVSKRVKDPSDPRCIAKGSATFEELDSMQHFSLDYPSGYIYSKENTKWLEILEKSLYQPGKESLNVFNETYPLNMNMRELVNTYKNGGYVSPLKVNEYPFRFLWNPTKVCENGQKVFLLFIIKSAIRHFDRRQAIRQTWANQELYNRFGIRRLFLTGIMRGQTRFHESLRDEIIYYGDTLQIDFVDMYYNNTWKTRGGIKWAVNECKQAEYVMLVDDDFYVASDLLVQLLHTAGRSRDFYMGWMNGNPFPVRNMRDKWFVSKRDFPYPVYPDFINAGAIVMSMDFVVDLHIASQYTNHFKFDDVFVGIVASKLKVTPVSCNIFTMVKILFTADRFWKTLVSHEYKPKELLQAWKCHVLISKHGLDSSIDTS